MIRLICFLVLVFSACQQHESTFYRVNGIDVSHYQKRIDWEEVINNYPLDFVFVKATEGASYKDSIFQQNWDALTDLSIKKGAYHFFRPQKNPEKQALNFIGSVELEKGDFAPVLDVEVLDGVEPQILIRRIKIWLVFIESHYGVRPILYSSLDFYTQYLKNDFNDYPLWIARYNHLQPKGINWAFWQFSDQGRIAGIEGNVDKNVFVGKKNELDAFCLH